MRTSSDKKYMHLAITQAHNGVRKGQTPFGACIIKGKQVVSCSHNQVWRKTDITAHAEIEAIRKACQKLKTVDLSGCVLYSTCEPCPMCFSAIHWARISKIIYGTSIRDAQKIGFNELPVSNFQMKKYGKSRVPIISGLLKKENLELFEVWAKRKNRKAY